MVSSRAGLSTMYMRQLICNLWQVGCCLHLCAAEKRTPSRSQQWRAGAAAAVLTQNQSRQ